jgi:hypothetical protein
MLLFFELEIKQIIYVSHAFPKILFSIKLQKQLVFQVVRKEQALKML